MCKILDLSLYIIYTHARARARACAQFYLQTLGPISGVDFVNGRVAEIYFAILLKTPQVILMRSGSEV